ncbi:MAG: hypothetical protein J6A47_00485 [Bacilli bacterium]|nr:hypothetical protein [Bacilli bacterium]
MEEPCLSLRSSLSKAYGFLPACEVVRYYCFKVPFEMVMSLGDVEFAKIDRCFDFCRGEETQNA